MSKYTDEWIKFLVEKITDRSIGQYGPKYLCFSTSYVLSLFLECNGISNHITGGFYGSIPHFWIKLEDYDEYILDATIKQFDVSQPSVYFGRISDNKITKEYILDQYNENSWFESYKYWCNPEFDILGVRRSEEIVRKLITNNIIGAAILNYEIAGINNLEKSRTQKSDLYELYFSAIRKWLREWKDDKIFLDEVRTRKVDKEFAFIKSTHL